METVSLVLLLCFEITFVLVAAPLSLKRTDISTSAADMRRLERSERDRAADKIKMEMEHKGVVETGGEAVGSGSSFCHFWFGFSSLPVELVHYQPRLRGRGETLDLAPRLPHFLSFPPALTFFSSSHGIFLAPPPSLLHHAPLPPPCPLIFFFISFALFAFHYLHFSLSLFVFSQPTLVVRNSSFLIRVIGC